MAGIATRKRLEREKKSRQLRKFAKLADDLNAARYKIDGLEGLLANTDDGWEHIRERIIDIGAKNGHWAGYPLPIHHAKLCVKPDAAIYRNLDGFSFAKEEDSTDGDYTCVNSWVDKKSGLVVVIVKLPNGKITYGFTPGNTARRRYRIIMDTIGASQVWSVRAEFTALARLKTLISPVAFRYYVLTGTFIETSKRSKVIYVFRKNRPTLAIGRALHEDDTRFLAALCLHPIGYYEGTFAGSMVPTDDVIAHLLMMRGDEHKFWAHANQHSIEAAEAGV